MKIWNQSIISLRLSRNLSHRKIIHFRVRWLPLPNNSKQLMDVIKRPGAVVPSKAIRRGRPDEISKIPLEKLSAAKLHIVRAPMDIGHRQQQIRLFRTTAANRHISTNLWNKLVTGGRWIARVAGL